MSALIFIMYMSAKQEYIPQSEAITSIVLSSEQFDTLLGSTSIYGEIADTLAHKISSANIAFDIATEGLELDGQETISNANEQLAQLLRDRKISVQDLAVLKVLFNI
jgi:hypothetical protein